MGHLAFAKQLQLQLKLPLHLQLQLLAATVTISVAVKVTVTVTVKIRSQKQVYNLVYTIKPINQPNKPTQYISCPVNIRSIVLM